MDQFKSIHNLLSVNYSNSADLFFRAVELNRISMWLRYHKLEIEPSVDIGCGNGFVFFTLFNQKSDFGIDNNEAGDAIVSEKTFRTSKLFITDASENWPKEIKNIQLFFSNCVIEHIPNFSGVLDQININSSKNAYFIFTVPNNKFERFMFPKFFTENLFFSKLAALLSKRRAKMLNHFNQFSKEEWIKILDKYSFKVVWYEEYLSNSSLFYWNFLAIVNRFLPEFILNSSFVNGLIQKFSRNFFYKDLVLTEGGCSLIVAKKN